MQFPPKKIKALSQTGCCDQALIVVAGIGEEEEQEEGEKQG